VALMELYGHAGQVFQVVEDFLLAGEQGVYP
jgi:hypothetical protein